MQLVNAVKSIIAELHCVYIVNLQCMTLYVFPKPNSLTFVMLSPHFEILISIVVNGQKLEIFIVHEAVLNIVVLF